MNRKSKLLLTLLLSASIFFLSGFFYQQKNFKGCLYSITLFLIFFGLFVRFLAEIPVSLSEITTPLLNPAWLQKSSPQNNNCPICLDSLEHDVVLTPCQHYYHYSCIIRWLREKNVCPICMASIIPQV